jgi:galactitol-specific phosphotransferase system IIB component
MSINQEPVSTSTTTTTTTQLVQMRLKTRTMASISHLQDLSGNTNRTDLVSSSIQVTEELFSRIKNGAKIIIEENGEKKELIINL